MKRKMTEKVKKQTMNFILENVEIAYTNDIFNPIRLIYISKDKNIIIYENIDIEKIIIIDKRDFDKKYKMLWDYDLQEKSLLVYLLDFLEEFFEFDYTKKILNDFFNTDLEEYEEYKVMKWSE